MLNLIIKNGLIIDCNGSPGYFGAVLVEGERVAIHRGDASGLEAARVIDADGVHVRRRPKGRPSMKTGLCDRLLVIDQAPASSQHLLWP